MTEIQNNGNILSVPAVQLPYNIGVGKIVFDKMIENKDAVAQIDGLSGQKDTYGSMFERSVRTAITMRSRGITSKDIITVCSYNHLDTNIPIIASLFLGVKTASVDPTLSLSDVVYLLNQVRPKMIFASPNGVKLIEDTLKEIKLDSQIVVFGETDKHSKFSEFLLESLEEKNFTPVEILNLKETVSIFFSSGTSGMPKGICVNHISTIAPLPRNKEALAMAGLVSLGYSNPYWISSFIFLVICIVSKQCRIILPKFEISNIWTMLEKYRITMMYLSPSQLSMVLSTGRPKDVNVSSLKFFLTGGAAVHKEQLDQLKKMFPGIFINLGYGQTELCGGPISFKSLSNPKDLELSIKHPMSVGRPQAGYSYKIVDPETEEILGPNQKGELRVKTEYSMTGYYNKDSSDAWDADGFLKTGDIAYYNEDYCFYIVDRLKEMLKFQSFQIAPAKLEEILLAHPAIQNAVVIGLPHPADGDHPLAIVVLKAGLEATPEEIEKYVEERVDDRQRLRGGVKIVKKIHTTPTGKFQRRIMRDLVLEGKL